MKRIVFCILLFLALPSLLFAQKKALQQEECKLWRTLREPNLSPDGRWVTYRYAYLYDAGNQDSELYLYDAERNRTIALKNVSEFFFFNNGKWVKMVQKTPVDTTGTTVDSTFIVRLKDWKKIVWDKTAFPNVDVSSPWIVYTEFVNEGNTSYNRLYVWNVETGEKIEIDRVGSYTFFNGRRSLVYEYKGDDETVLRVRDLKGKSRDIFKTGKNLFGRVWFDEEREVGTFTVASDSSRVNNPDLLYSFSLAPADCHVVVNFEEITGLPEGMKVTRNPYPLLNGGRDIMLEIEPVKMPRPAPRKKSDLGFELELWSWNEPLSHRRQRPARGGFNPMDYPKFIYHVDSKECVKLSDPGMSAFVIPESKDFDYIFATSSTPYLTQFDWRHELNSDIYLIRLADGKQTKLLTNVRNVPVWSPNGKYAVWYDVEARTWYNIDMVSGELKDISSAIGYPMYDELHDMPKAPSAYGYAGWINEGKSLVLYDRYDMWVVDLTGHKQPYSLTGEYGRKHDLELRLVEAKGNDLTKGAILSSFNTRTKSKGVYALEANGKVNKLLEGEYAARIVKMADDGKTCVWSKSSFSEYGDLWWSNLKFTNPRRITNTNPQQTNYLWGTARLERWKTFDGRENDGILFLPEGYDPNKRYPVIVTFYERHTEELYSYRLPELSSSVIDVPTYVSNGYVVFMPDVHFKIGDPAESCYNSVVSGVQMLIDKGIADKDHIGVIGHSWGGFEVAYLVSRTNIFRCASPGAAVSNTISSYTALRGGGMPRLYVYEDAQGRLGKTLWEDWEMYIRNSPIFYADKIKTPLLIFHCDGDNAVPFAQGLDLFMAMRRLQRPAWLLNYKGESHPLNSEAAMIDWGVRMRQFFDHYLKESPAPRWMTEGISIDEQGYELKYELTE